MFRIDKHFNRIEQLKTETFKDLGFREREHIQEWICAAPECLGEELLVIQKEFDGFDDTRERLDLLALDKQQNLVIIENKLDDSGRDVTWQALKYASYCSSLTKEQIKDIYQQYLDRHGAGEKAEDKLAEFYKAEYDELLLNQGISQRIILIAARFRKEVTSTVLWLLNYKIRLQCFKITPFSLNDELFLNVEQLLPVRETEDLSIRMSNKAQEGIESQETLKERHHLRLAFWKQFIDKSNQVNSIFQNNSPSKDNWIVAGTGMAGVTLEAKISKNSARVEIYINRGDKQENEHIFDLLAARRDAIEQAADLVGKLVWERGEHKMTSLIRYADESFNVFDETQWEAINAFLMDAAQRMDRVFRPEIERVKKVLKQGV